MSTTPWDILGIGDDADAKAIKRAYARALKSTRPDEDPIGFQRLNDAYEWALGAVRHRDANATPPTASDEGSPTPDALPELGRPVDAPPDLPPPAETERGFDFAAFFDELAPRLTHERPETLRRWLDEHPGLFSVDLKWALIPFVVEALSSRIHELQTSREHIDIVYDFFGIDAKLQLHPAIIDRVREIEYCLQFPAVPELEMPSDEQLAKVREAAAKVALDQLLAAIEAQSRGETHMEGRIHVPAWHFLRTRLPGVLSLLWLALPRNLKKTLDMLDRLESTQSSQINSLVAPEMQAWLRSISNESRLTIPGLAFYAIRGAAWALPFAAIAYLMTEHSLQLFGRQVPAWISLSIVFIALWTAGAAMIDAWAVLIRGLRTGISGVVQWSERLEKESSSPAAHRISQWTLLGSSVWMSVDPNAEGAACLAYIGVAILTTQRLLGSTAAVALLSFGMLVVVRIAFAIVAPELCVLLACWVVWLAYVAGDRVALRSGDLWDRNQYRATIRIEPAGLLLSSIACALVGCIAMMVPG